jgi:hypothetical protein
MARTMADCLAISEAVRRARRDVTILLPNED